MKPHSCSQAKLLRTQSVTHYYRFVWHILQAKIKILESLNALAHLRKCSGCFIFMFIFI